jgi:hypothetical protein
MKSIYCIHNTICIPYENKISFDGMNVWKVFFNYNKHNIKDEKFYFQIYWETDLQII